MKNIILIGSILTSSAYSSEYIVKLKSDELNFKSISGLSSAQKIPLSYGNFLKINLKNNKNLSQIKNNPNVEYIEENFIYKTMNAPVDKDFSKQWGLNNDGKNSGSWWSRGIAGVDISALKAWEITKGSKDIKIAVIDTGVDYTHEDLKNNIMINTAEKNGLPGVDDDGNGYIDDIYGYDFANSDADPMDGHGHGTHCAGVIGASHNSIGIAGIMAHVEILPIKFLTDSGSGTLEGALLAIDYARMRGVNIMSNSWGGGGRSQALFEAIERASNAGIIFTAAAGNESNNNDKNPSYPASYELDNIISVGAMDGKGKKAKFSNYGISSVHVFAPGVDIYSTVTKNKYDKMSGTSMACPHISGVAGLILSHEPNLSAKDVKERIMRTAISSDELSPYAASGYADVFESLTK